MEEKILHSSFFPEFVFMRRGAAVRSVGALTRVHEAEAVEVARQRGTAVVGLVPFDPAQEPVLWVPEGLAPVDRGGSGSGFSSSGKDHVLPALRRIHGLDNPSYRTAVGQAVDRMNHGELEKVVLARLLEAEFEQPLNPAYLLDNSLVQQPRTFVFSVKLPESKSYLMGASPELVFRSESGSFTTHPLAGTKARAAIPGSTDDAQLGEELIRSPKDRAEHATVVEDIRRRLEPLAQSMNVPATPSLLATPQLWHLGTKITGRLQPGVSSLDGARAIHPTPAICGSPTEKALELINQLEGFDRKFFGGLVGWMDAEGNGEWALVLRCAEISEQYATLFAGAGIVRASVPAFEHAETGSKFGSFAQVLGLDLSSLAAAECAASASQR